MAVLPPTESVISLIWTDFKRPVFIVVASYLFSDRQPRPIETVDPESRTKDRDLLVQWSLG